MRNYEFQARTLADLYSIHNRSLIGIQERTEFLFVCMIGFSHHGEEQ